MKTSDLFTINNNKSNFKKKLEAIRNRRQTLQTQNWFKLNVTKNKLSTRRVLSDPHSQSFGCEKFAKCFETTESNSKP